MKKMFFAIGTALLIGLPSCNNEFDKLDAELIAEQYVEQILKSPGSAEFGTANTSVLENGFHIDSYVDGHLLITTN